MKHRTSSAIIAVITLFLFLCLSQCTSSQDTKREVKPTLKLGILLPLTGPLSQRGEEEKKAIELAINDFNSQSNDTVVKAIFENSNGVNLDDVTKKLFGIDKVSALVASTTSVSRSIFYLANNNKIIMAFLCSDPTIQKASPYIFRLYESTETEADQIVSYYINQKKNKKIIVLYLNHPGISEEVTDYLIPKFMHNKINIVFYEPYNIDRKDFKDTIERIKNSGADSLLILGSGAEYHSILKELARQKLIGKIEIVGGFPFLVSQHPPDNLLEGVIVAAPEYALQKNEKAKAFEERFSKFYGHAPNIYAAFAYNAIQILSGGLVEGLVIGKGNADTVSFKVTNRKYYGVIGDVSVDNMGGLIVPMRLGVIREGKIVPLYVNESK
jgi:branched-chain amino acid transport system substrate-binding protein